MVNLIQWTLMGCSHSPSHTDRSLTHLQTPPLSMLMKQTLAERGKNRGSTSGKSKKISSGASVLPDNFNHLSQVVQSQKHLTVRHGIGASQKYGFEACMQRIMAIPNFINTSLFDLPTLRWRTRITRKY
ncbi:hypothetical protein ACSBR2_020413 [Camellia fascicularis]